MDFISRTTAPKKDNKYWVHTSKGGLNSCLLIKENSVLPNCVGYTWGRAYEILKSKPKLSRANADKWYHYNDGYKRGMEPKLGAIACWKNKNGGGHVAVVEKILNDKSIITSNSNYKGKYFFLLTIKPPYNTKNMIFQGFIYLNKNSNSDGFLVNRGYFCLGDKHENIGKIAEFMYDNFPLYTKKSALGNYYGINIYNSLKEFQKRANKEKIYNSDIDGCVGPKTLEALEYYGFKVG